MKPSTARSILVDAILHNLTLPQSAPDAAYIRPYLEGSPGVGKSTISRQACMIVAEKTGEDFAFSGLNLLDYDSAELAGWAVPSLDNSEMIRVKPDWLPTSGKGLIFVDELPQAPTSNQNKGRQIVLERRAGVHRLPHGWVTAGAGNRADDRAGTNAMPTHMRDVLMFLPVEADLDDTLDYFNKIGVHDTIRAFLRYRPEFLNKFDRNAKSCPTPRSWETVSSILKANTDQTALTYSVAGQVGDAAGVDFMAFVKLQASMPNIDKIIADPDSVDIPENTTIMYAVSAALASRATEKTAANILKYLLKSEHQEFTGYFVNDVVSRDAQMKRDRSIRKWITEEGGADLLVGL